MKSITAQCLNCGNLYLHKIIVTKESTKIFLTIRKKKIKEVDKSVFLEIACPSCGEKELVRIPKKITGKDTYGLSADKETRLKWGKYFQDKFKTYWNLHYKQEHGKLRLTDINPYDSDPDFYAKSLNLHLEIKNKWIYTDEMYNPPEIWINKKSIDYKVEHAKKKPNETFILVILIQDLGWLTINVEEASACEIREPSRAMSGSGDFFYQIPLKKLIPFKKFMQTHFPPKQ